MTDHLEAAHEDHRKAYYWVFGALVAGTVLTVLAASADVGRLGNVTIGVLIACIKASLVAYFFMHLKHEDRIFWGVAIFPLVLFLVLVLLLLPDVGFAHASPLDDPASSMYKPPAGTAHP
ncbi:MAG: cytochrome C oxidase subunit IV family protein [Planctomycetes bacterium]|nr:cytochrome C oxidase subunit IV family protein [Planctomycetota bacterium]